MVAALVEVALGASVGVDRGAAVAACATTEVSFFAIAAEIARLEGLGGVAF
jgi:hypothetical protein